MKLQTKIQILVLVVVLGGAGIANLLVTSRINHGLQDLQSGWFSGLVLALSEHISHGNAEGDMSHAKRSLEAIVENMPALEYARLVDPAGHVIADSAGMGNPATHAGSRTVAEHDPQDHREVRTTGSRIVGMDARLHMGINHQATDKLIADTRDEVLTVALTAALLGGMVALFVGRRFSQPLAQLSASLRTYGDGKPVEPLHAGGSNAEVAELVGAFNRMLEERRPADLALREANRRLETVLDAVPHGVEEVDCDGIIIYSNPAHHRILGYSPGELVGKRIWDVCASESQKHELQSYLSHLVAEQPTPESHQAHSLRKDGTPVVLQVDWTYKRDDEGRLLGIVAVVMDITERKRSEKAKTRSQVWLTEAQQIAHLGNWNWDIETGELHWSDETYRIFGREPQAFEATYAAFLDAVHWEDREYVANSVTTALEDGLPYSIDHRIVRPDGEVRIVHGQAQVAFDGSGRPNRMAGIIHDITARKQAELALQESRTMLQAVLDAIPVRVFWKNTDCVYLGANRSLGKDAGLESPAQIIGKTDFELSWSAQAELYRSDDRHVMQTRRPKLSYEEPQTWPDGTELVLRTSKTPLQDADGNVIGVLGCYEDMTQRKQAEEELRQHREHLEALVAQRTARLEEQAQIIDQIHDSVVTTDPQGCVTGWNRGAERQFGYTKQQAFGNHISCLYAPGEQAKLRRVIALLPERGAIEVETRLRSQNDELFHGRVSWTLRHDKNRPSTGMIAHIIDVTERKQAEAALEQRTAELCEMNRELESFSYSVSHDLRAPLRSIGGFSQAILEDFSNELNSTGKDYLQRVCAASQRMSELVDDLLMLSRVTRREMDYQSVDLSGMAREIADRLKETQPGRDVEFNIQKNLHARGDEKLLRIAVENLLANAWKYTRNRNKAVIELGTVIRACEQTYCVRDNGVGFDMRYAHKLFAPFQRLHSHCEFEGNGIGLATVQRVVGRHRGRIWSEAQVDGGASFYFQLPAEAVSG